MYHCQIPSTHTKHFVSFLMQIARKLNRLPAPVCPHSYDPELFKARMNRHWLSSVKQPRPYRYLRSGDDAVDRTH